MRDDRFPASAGILLGSAGLPVTVAGLAILWRHSRRPHAVWSARLLLATMLIGFGLFNVVEGIVDHLLGRLGAEALRRARHAPAPR